MPRLFTTRGLLVFLASVAALVYTVPAPSQRTQRPLPRDSALAFGDTPLHNISFIPAEDRQRVLGDPATLQFYASLLEGRTRLARGMGHFDTTVVLWWLAESGDPAFVPLFLEYTSPTRNIGAFQMAAYGLARNASIDAAAQRLRSLARTELSMRTVALGAVLAAVNDTLTRSILREIPLSRLPSQMQQRVKDVLASPALARGEGRAFCLPHQTIARAPDGRYRCIARPLPQH